MTKVGVLFSRVRVEEKLLIASLEARGIEFDRIDPRQTILDLHGNGFDAYDAVLVRCLSHSRAYYLTRRLEDLGVPALSPHRAVANCGDKLLTSALLQTAGLPMPR